MESRTDAHAVGFGSAVPPSEFRSSKSADRLTPAHPERELVESDFAEATPGSIPTPQKQLRPRKRGEVCPAEPSPPDTALKREQANDEDGRDRGDEAGDSQIRRSGEAVRTG
jgi:hypothetical protein